MMGGKDFCLFFIQAGAVLLIILALLLFVPRLLGHVLTIGVIRPTSLQHAKYVYPNLFTISASSLHLKFHLPTSKNPYWAKFFVNDYYYDDPRSAVSFASLEGTLWFLPVLFRFTSGALITLKFDDFRIQVHDSQYTPQWLRLVRDNLVYTVVNEETVRLHHIKTRFVSTGLIGMTGSEQGYQGPVEKPGLGPEQDLDEVKIQTGAQQWHIHNARNNRMYTLGVVDIEIRKSWVEDRRPFVFIAKNIKWTKVSLVGQYRRNTSLLRYVAKSILQAPQELIKIIRDPLLIIDVDCQRTDVTFSKFHIQDSALIEQGGILIRRQYEKSVDRGLLSDASIDSFVHALLSFFDVQNTQN